MFTEATGQTLVSAGHVLYRLQTKQGTGYQEQLVVTHLFESTSSGLVPFYPAMLGSYSDEYFSTGYALGYGFDTGYFRFDVPLAADFKTHRIELPPSRETFAVFGRRAHKLRTPGSIQLYSEHREDASHSEFTIAPGEVMNFYQSDPSSLKKLSGRIVVIVAWAPVSMSALRGGSAGVEMLDFNQENTWLQIQIDGHTGWIHGDASFRAIGLRPTS